MAMEDYVLFNSAFHIFSLFLCCLTGREAVEEQTRGTPEPRRKNTKKTVSLMAT